MRERTDSIDAARQFKLALAALVALVAIGTSGYRIIEGWSLLDCLYMTLITLSTVGFREIAPPSTAGRIFTMTPS